MIVEDHLSLGKNAHSLAALQAESSGVPTPLDSLGAQNGETKKKYARRSALWKWIMQD